MTKSIKRRLLQFMVFALVVCAAALSFLFVIHTLDNYIRHAAQQRVRLLKL